MANDLTKNPLILDTVGTVLADKLISINSVQWVDPVNVGDAVILRDQNGNTIFKASCVTQKQSLIKYFRPGFTFTGLNVVAITSGEIHLLFNHIGTVGDRNTPYRD
jgi:hypothetical protein